MYKLYKPPNSEIGSDELQQFDNSNPISPRGRFGILSFIAWNLLLVLLLFAIFLTVAIIFGDTNYLDVKKAPSALKNVVFIITLVAIGFSFVFAIRRLHDIGLAGTWAILLNIPVINILFGLFLLLKSGNTGENKYAKPRLNKVWETMLGIIAITLGMLFLLFFLYESFLLAADA